MNLEYHAEKIEERLTSIEGSLDRIAGSLARISSSVEEKAGPRGRASSPERDELKKELTLIGVTFNHKASTVMLKELLKKSSVEFKQKAAAREEQLDKARVMREGIPTVTLDIVRKKLTEYVTDSEENKHEAQKLLASLGVKKLSEVDKDGLIKISEYLKGQGIK